MKVPVKKTSTRTTIGNDEKSAVDLEEQIRRRAYELYVRRGREDGHEREDWLAAEAELARESTKPRARTAEKKTPQAPVASTVKTKAKQVKKSRSATQTNTEETRNGY